MQSSKPFKFGIIRSSVIRSGSLAFATSMASALLFTIKASWPSMVTSVFIKLVIRTSSSTISIFAINFSRIALYTIDQLFLGSLYPFCNDAGGSLQVDDSLWNKNMHAAGDAILGIRNCECRSAKVHCLRCKPVPSLGQAWPLFLGQGRKIEISMLV